MQPNDKEYPAWKIIEDECKPFGGYVKVLQECGGTTVSQIWIRTMEKYASIKLKQAQDEIAELKEDLSMKEALINEFREVQYEERKQLKAKDELIDKMASVLLKIHQNPNDYPIVEVVDIINQHKEQK